MVLSRITCSYDLSDEKCKEKRKKKDRKKRNTVNQYNFCHATLDINIARFGVIYNVRIDKTHADSLLAHALPKENAKKKNSNRKRGFIRMLLYKGLSTFPLTSCV